MNLLTNAIRQLRALAVRIERRSAAEAGYTLIELMIVMQILAIALAVAVPNYLGLEARADKRAASSDVRNAISTAELYYTDPTKGALSYKNLTVARAAGDGPWRQARQRRGLDRLHDVLPAEGRQGPHLAGRPRAPGHGRRRRAGGRRGQLPGSGSALSGLGSGRETRNHPTAALI